MIYFNNLKILDTYFKEIQEITGIESVFLVGGPIRDLLLGISGSIIDIDLTCAGNPDQIFNGTDKRNISIFKTEKFGTITIIPKSKKTDDIIKYELTPMRSEGKYEDFRHPGNIEWINDILLDSKRRDFTINSIYYFSYQTKINISNSIFLKSYDVMIKKLEEIGYIFLADFECLILQSESQIHNIFPDGKLDKKNLDLLLNMINYYSFKENSKFMFENISILIDPNKGIQDIISKKIKAVGNPDNRFCEDALRIIRAIRFVNIFNQKIEKKFKSNPNLLGSIKYFDIEPYTWRSMKKNYFIVKYIAKERIKEEILKVFKGDNPFGFIALLDELNLLKLLFPAVFLCKHIDQPVRYHPFDVYAHTMLTLWNLQKINSNYLVKLGMLYHDVGKPDQYYYVGIGLLPEERKEMHGLAIHHPRYGIDIAINDLKTLGFGNKEIEEITFYIRYHMIPGEILNSKEENYESKIRKLMGEHGYSKVDNLLDIAIADRNGQFNPVQENNIDGILNLKKILKKIYEKEGEFTIKELAINGNDIMKLLNIEPGPKVGLIINKIFDWVIDDINSRNNKNTIYEFIKNNIF